MTPAPTITWRSACGRGHVEERRGLYWGYVDGQHVCTLLAEARARDVVAVKLLRKDGGE